MELFSFVLSATQGMPIAGVSNTEVISLAPFFLGDIFNGRISVVSETGDPANPTTPLPLDASTTGNPPAVLVTGAGDANYNTTFFPNGTDANGRNQWLSSNGSYEIKWSAFFNGWAMGVKGFNQAFRNGSYYNTSDVVGQWSTILGGFGTGVPPAPTSQYFTTVSANASVCLTDGASIVYAPSAVLAIQNTGDIVFILNVAGTALIAAFANSDTVSAFLEVRATSLGQNKLFCREPVIIKKSATATGTLQPLPVPMILYNYVVDALTGTVTSLDHILSANLPLKCLIVTAIGGSLEAWTVTQGSANPADPTGQIAPIDTATSGKFYMKIAWL